MVPSSPAVTSTDEPVVVLLPVDTDAPDVASLAKPLLVTVAVSPMVPFTHVFRSVSVTLRVLVMVQTIAVSAAFTVSVLPGVLPDSGVALPVHASVEL